IPYIEGARRLDTVRTTMQTCEEIPTEIWLAERPKLRPVPSSLLYATGRMDKSDSYSTVLAQKHCFGACAGNTPANQRNHRNDPSTADHPNLLARGRPSWHPYRGNY